MRSVFFSLVAMFMAYVVYRTVYIALGPQKRATVRRVVRENWLAFAAILVFWIALVALSISSLSLRVF